MTVTEEDMPVYRFASCELHVRSREVVKNGELVSLQPKAFDLLLFLIENRNRAVNKDELLQALWPGVHVSETALTRCIMKARRAIDDDDAKESAIKTVHGHGYRFVVPLGNKKTQSEGASTHSQSGERRFLWPVMMAAALLLAVVALVVVYNTERSLADGGIRVAVMPVQNATGDPSLDWTTLGATSFVSHFLQQASDVEVVPTRFVMRMAGDDAPDPAGPLSLAPDLMEGLRRAGGASHIIVARFEKTDTLLSLRYSIWGPDGPSEPQVLVGEKPIVLARDLAQNTIRSLPDQGARRLDLRRVSDDDFINEAYARGRDKQLKGQAEEARDLFKVAAEHEPENFWIRYEYALSTRMMGELDEAENMLTDLVSEAEQGGDAEQIVSAHNAIGVLRWRRGNTTAAKQHYLKALDFIENPAASRQAGVVLTNLAIIAGDEGDLAQKRRYLGRALTVFSEAGFESPPGYVWNNFASLELSLGNLAEAERNLQLALDSFRLEGNQRSETFSLNELGRVRQRQARLDEAQDFFERSLRIADSINSRFSQLSSYLSLAEVNLDKGDFSVAEGHAQRALAIAQELDSRRLGATAVELLGRVNLKMEKPDVARDYFEQAKSRYETLDHQSGQHRQILNLARVELLLGGVETAAAVAQDALALADENDDKRLELEALELASETAAIGGNTVAAHSYLEQALERARAQSQMAVAARLAAQIGHLYLDRGDLPSASSYLGIIRGINPELVDTLKLEARYAYLDGRLEEARSLVAIAREKAGQSWSLEDEAIFVTLMSQK